MIDHNKILILLKEKPGLKAREIANALDAERKDVNSALYGNLRGKVIQDSSYRWWLKDSKTEKKELEKLKLNSNTTLSKLCRYYLECLSQDDESGVSAFASSRFELDYVSVDKLPFLDETNNIFADEATKRLLNKVRKDRSRLMLYLGYPVRLNYVKAKTGWAGYFIEPIFLFPFHSDPTNPYSVPTLDDSMPILNFRALRSLTSIDSGNLMDEAIQLSEDLGLNNPDSDLPDFEEIIPRLRLCRPEWDWREDTDPYALSNDVALSSVTSPGIYNQAVILAGERSPYTQGLETELDKLEQVDEKTYSETALGTWINNGNVDSTLSDSQPLLEILPLNTEQRQAVLQGLNNALTVITGPPGTGKSQVVTSLLINAAWQGKKILFASKNNKAVDVVETRVNALGDRPILLRLGANEYQAKLADYLVSLLSAKANNDDEKNFQRYLEVHKKLSDSFRTANDDLNTVINLRNELDKKEQSIEETRGKFSDKNIKCFRKIDFASLTSKLASFANSLDQANPNKQSFFTRLFWGNIKKSRYDKLVLTSKQVRDLSISLEIPFPAEQPSDSSFNIWKKFWDELKSRFELAKEITDYYKKLEALQSLKSLESISKTQSELIELLSENSLELWQCWLRLQPNRMTNDDRTTLNEYCSLLKMVIEGQENNQNLGKNIFTRYYSLFPKLTNILGCWAVTSLIARRLPFEPGYFDILVIDEASQCDIASALPLLYRAKQVVIIGDPKQLAHISNLPIKQDRILLVKNKLDEGYAGWSYSVNSLFDLATRFIQPGDIVDLRDHHRSHADIINFSNKYFYKGDLRIATNYKKLRRINSQQPAVRWIDIKGEMIRPQNGGALNVNEAAAVVKEIERIVLKQRYTGSIGVVSPFRSQVNKIRDLVYQNDLLTTKLDNMDFLTETVHRFQGDERDIMIFSPVVSSNIDKLRGAQGFLNSNPNLFNVAITRARAELIVVGDYQKAIDSKIDYLSKFASYVGKVDTEANNKNIPQTEFGPAYPPVAKPELVSDWERLFYRVLYERGFRPIPQFDEPPYILDFALFKGDRKLDIEIDGEHYHRNWNGELCRRDQIRTQRLIEYGWDVMRFWVYEVRDDIVNCVSRVNKWMETQ